MRRHLSALLAAVFLVTTSQAQQAPSASEIAAFSDLHRAAHDDDAAAILRLIGEGANIEARDANQRTPVHVAAFASADAALTALAKSGADMNALEAGRYDAVTIAAVANDPELVSLAIDLGNRADLVTSIYDGTALIAAAHLGHHEVVRRLIAGGAPLDHVNNLHWTAVIEAIVLGDGGPDHLATLGALVDAGADLSLTDRHGQTPLALAQSRGYADMIELLTAAGAP